MSWACPTCGKADENPYKMAAHIKDCPKPPPGTHYHPSGAIVPDDPTNPPHYKNHPSGVECIDIVRHMNFNRGNAVKYVWRAGEKGSEIEDLRKAIWYLEDEIKRLEGESK